MYAIHTINCYSGRLADWALLFAKAKKEKYPVGTPKDFEIQRWAREFNRKLAAPGGGGVREVLPQRRRERRFTAPVGGGLPHTKGGSLSSQQNFYRRGRRERREMNTANLPHP
jgi:hypothetical protein